MAGTSRTDIEGFYGALSGNIAIQWGEDMMATVDDKLHMTETASVQTVQGPINWSNTSMMTFAGSFNATSTGVNTWAGPFNATNTSVNTFAGPLNATNTNAHTFGGPVEASSFEAGAGATIQEFSTDTTLGGASSTAAPTEGATKEYVDNRTLETSSHKEWYPCAWMSEHESDKQVLRAGGYITPVDAGGNSVFFRLQLPTNRGGKTLRITGIQVGLLQADASNYMNSYDIEGVVYSGETTLRTQTGLTISSAQKYEDTFTTVDAGSYDQVNIYIGLTLATGFLCDIMFVNIQCYYA